MMKKRFAIQIGACFIALVAATGVRFAAPAQTPSPNQTTGSSPSASDTTGSKTPANNGSSSAGSAAPKSPSASAATKAPAAGAALTTDKQKDSYALGVNIARGVQQQPLEIDVTSFLQGMKDTLQNSKSQLTDDQIKAALAQLQTQANAKMDAANKAAGEANLKAGQDFLAENKSKEGVMTTPSGLQYKVLTLGTGTRPALNDTVVCDYSGTLIDGTEFDSSYKRGQPATFPVSGVIKGWTEALQMMPVGSKWELFIPPDLAYGNRGTGPIGPNSTLIFQVELHSIQGK